MARLLLCVVLLGLFSVEQPEFNHSANLRGCARPMSRDEFRG